MTATVAATTVPAVLTQGNARLRRAARRLALAVSITGCASSLPTPPAGTATFSGAITGSVVVVLGATSASDGLRFFIQSPLNDFPSVAFAAALPGTSLASLTYDDTNGTAASTTVQEAATGGVTWVQVSDQVAQVGTFSLAITDPGQVEATDGGTAWPSPHGGLAATLVPLGTLTDAGIAVAVSF